MDNTNTSMLYGSNELPLSVSYIQPRESFSYQPKEVTEPIPIGAKINSVEKNVTVRQIENGFIKVVNICTCYEIKEGDGDSDTRYHYSTKETYSTEKPMDVLKIYM